MTDFAGSQTHTALSTAFVRDSIAGALHLWFAQRADVEGRPAEAAMFRSSAAAATSNAHGHLEFLADVGDPVSGLAIGDTDDNVAAVVAAHADRATPGFSELAGVARDEGFGAIADWFDTLAGSSEPLAGSFDGSGANRLVRE